MTRSTYREVMMEYVKMRTMCEKRKIKVLMVAGSVNVGGIENQLMHLLRQANKTKFQIDFTTTEEHPFYQDEIESLGGHCIRIPATEGRHFLRYCKALYGVIKDGGYDVVHSHELYHSGMVLLTARLAGVKCRFVHAHSSNQGRGNLIRRAYNWLMRRLILQNATEFLACSSLSARFLFGDSVIGRKNYHLIVNSVETARFLPTEERTASTDKVPLEILQVGRFADEKNFLFSVLIAEECRRRGDRFRFLFVGNNGEKYESAVRQLIAEKDLEDTVCLLGIRKDVDQLVKRADAFLLPSKYEGMPLTLIEAQTAGLPCVVADRFSHEVDFGIGNVDWLRLEDGAAAWADALERAIAKGRASRQIVVSAIEAGGFDSGAFAKKICDLYEMSVNG